MKFLCKLLGHKWSGIEKVMFDIMNMAINRNQFIDTELKCERCGVIKIIK